MGKEIECLSQWSDIRILVVWLFVCLFVFSLSKDVIQVLIFLLSQRISILLLNVISATLWLVKREKHSSTYLITNVAL